MPPAPPDDSGPDESVEVRATTSFPASDAWSRIDGPFEIAVGTYSQQQPPAWLTGEIAPNPMEHDPLHHATPELISDAVCLGDLDRRAELLQRIRTDAEDTLTPGWSSWLGEPPCQRQEFCSWAANLARTEDDVAVRRVFATSLSGCGLEVADVVQGPDADAHTLVEWAAGLEEPPWSTALGRAVEARFAWDDRQGSRHRMIRLEPHRASSRRARHRSCP